MPSLNKEDIVELLQWLDSQAELSQEYDASNNREMAFLALWTALEFSVKRVAMRHKGALKHSISLPQKIEFNNCLKHFSLGGCGLWDFMDSKKKYRIRRNELAHSATPFGTEKTYREYVNEAHRVIAVFRTRLGKQLSALKSDK